MKVAVGLRRVAAGKRTSGRRAAQIAFSQSVGEINREFARNGLLVTRINDSEENLEDYFSKLIGGGGIA